jgi:hypothetical protein
MAKLIRQIIAGIGALALLVVGVQLIGSTSATAHTNSVIGTALCQADGTYTVTWNVTNDYTGTDVVTVPSWTPAGSQLSPATITLGSHGTGPMSQTGIPGNATVATLTNVHGDWTDPADPWQADTGPVSVSLTKICLPSKTPTAPTAHPGACVHNVIVQPSISIPGDAGISWALDNKPVAGNQDYPVSPGVHTVDASSTSLTLIGTTHWPFTLTQAAGDCGTKIATPVIPTVTQTRCVNHAPTAPTIVLQSTPGITYTVSRAAPYTPGETVVITATTATGYKFDSSAAGWPSGWTMRSPTKAVSKIVLQAPLNCGTAAMPTAPTVTQTACRTGSTTPTAPTIVLASTPGVTYTTNKSAPYRAGETVLVTATATKGHFFASPPSGWTKVSDSVLTDQVHLNKLAPNACTLSAKVTKASFTAEQCVHGQPQSGSYTVPSSTGVVYTVNGKTTPAGTYHAPAGTTVQIVATPKSGYKLAGQRTWTHTFGATPQCSGNASKHVHHPRTTTPPPNQLANTGMPTAHLISIGVALLILGSLTMLAATRRRETKR